MRRIRLSWDELMHEFVDDESSDRAVAKHIWQNQEKKQTNQNHSKKALKFIENWKGISD